MGLSRGRGLILEGGLNRRFTAFGFRSLHGTRRITARQEKRLLLAQINPKVCVI